MRIACLLPAVLLIAVLPAPPAAAADAERGRILYESRCLGCHSQSVHGREKRAAADFAAVRSWIARWDANLGRQWSEDEVDDVAVYLNARFYRFACPPPACKVTGSRAAARPALARR